MLDPIGLLLGLLWLVVGFIAVRWIAGRYFTEPRQDVIVAGAVVIAFAAGALWPFGRPGTTASHVATIAPAAAPAPAAAGIALAPPVDVSSTCRTASLQQGKTRAVVDVVGLLHAGQEKAMPANFAADPGDSLMLQGWAVDPTAKRTASAVCLVIDGALERRATALYGVTRNDVAAALGASEFTKSGFHLQIPIRELKPGFRHVAVAVVSPGGIGIVQTKAVVIVP